MELKACIRETKHLTRGAFGIDFGWGNGYVFLPKGHPLYRKHYDVINKEVNVHGGLTFSEYMSHEWLRTMGFEKEYHGMWCVGFDTAHYGDSLNRWPKEKVEEETENLRLQLINYIKKIT